MPEAKEPRLLKENVFFCDSKTPQTSKTSGVEKKLELKNGQLAKSYNCLQIAVVDAKRTARALEKTPRHKHETKVIYPTTLCIPS